MSKTYFAPTTSEVKIAGNAILSISDPPAENPDNPGNPGTGPSAPARKLYV